MLQTHIDKIKKSVANKKGHIDLYIMSTNVGTLTL